MRIGDAVDYIEDSCNVLELIVQSIDLLSGALNIFKQLTNNFDFLNMLLADLC